MSQPDLVSDLYLVSLRWQNGTDYGRNGRLDYSGTDDICVLCLLGINLMSNTPQM